MQRILIIGCSGAGKSTLARQMAKILHLPVIHLDYEYWQPNWTPTSNDQFDQKITQLIATDQWIMDGNYHRTLPQRLARADTVIHLDFPRLRCLTRICKRVLLNCNFNHTRPDMAQGCTEQWDWEFIEWVWNFKREIHPKNLNLLSRCPENTKVITLRNPREVQTFLVSL